MHPLAERVIRTIRRHALAPPGCRVIVALSGGADSVALLHLLRDLEHPCGFVLSGVAHLNHQLRGRAADEDEEFCRNLARRVELPFDMERIDVGAVAAVRHESLEAAGRAARYAFLARSADRLSADRIAVGHTRDDQAETYLLRLLRGAGPRGLAGIHPRVGSVVRPLLEVTHTDLRRYLAGIGATCREDETNADTTIARNRVRHELLPLLESRFSPAIVDVLSREAAIALDDAAFLDEAAGAAAAPIVHVRGCQVEVDATALLAHPPAIARRVLLQALALASGGRFVGFSHAEQLLALAAGREGLGPLDLPGQTVRRLGGRLVLRPLDGAWRRPAAEPNAFRYSLSVPGEVVVAEAGCALVAERAARWPAGDDFPKPTLTDPALAVADAAQLPAVLFVRNRKPGDRFRPLGLTGTKKLQDLFVDRKVRAELRDQVPLVVDERDQIVWVAGHALADQFKVTSETKAVVILKLKDLGVIV